MACGTVLCFVIQHIHIQAIQEQSTNTLFIVFELIGVIISAMSVLSIDIIRNETKSANVFVLLNKV